MSIFVNTLGNVLNDALYTCLSVMKQSKPAKFLSHILLINNTVIAEVII
jgi:hypothetical protein